MAKTIDHYLGRARLRALTSLPPEQFVADYIALSRAHPDDPEITPLSAASIATVQELEHLQGARASVQREPSR
jgi:hypothetical protein